MVVNGLRLPAHLIELIEAGHWHRPNEVAVLTEMSGVERPEDFTFHSMPHMIRETESMVRAWKRGYGHIYSLTSSIDSDGSNNPELLDVNRSVLVAGNWNEEVICLDYRENLDEPKVVCGIWPDTRGACQWKVIATTFDEFAYRLSL